MSQLSQDFFQNSSGDFSNRNEVFTLIPSDDSQEVITRVSYPRRYSKKKRNPARTSKATIREISGSDSRKISDCGTGYKYEEKPLK